MKTTRTVAVIVNGSTPGSRYFVNLEKGYCTCPAWRFQRFNGRACKHLDAMRERFNVK